ncbi:hypothetical protein V6N11_047959 [Hibiscus sabdariffa]|uniref:Uncharacterized protein n=1 Tax=Hibiscus sabdariffa TaxID=183260 RepID=A0ABR2NXI2_9ROSI
MRFDQSIFSKYSCAKSVQITRAQPQAHAQHVNLEYKQELLEVKISIVKLLSIAIKFRVYSFLALTLSYIQAQERSLREKIHLFDIGRVKLKIRVNTVLARDQMHELTPPKDRGIASDQGSKLLGLRDKPVTQQDVMLNSEDPCRDRLSQPDPLSLPRHPPCHPAEADYQGRSIDKVKHR